MTLLFVQMLVSYFCANIMQVGEATVFHIFFLVIQPMVYMGIVGSFPFNSFLSGVFSCVGTAVHAVCLRIQVNKESKEFKDLPPERAFADCSLQPGAAFGYYEFPWICRLNDRRERCLFFTMLASNCGPRVHMG
ncbi:Dolichyl-diphosphooligosaccharide--protein glycosyltransferase subunit DAD1 [Acorus gramineus]|uniref:Dolichyl-diphosphooligosaccharide--protein glycosyltransferase subunit DAD1 n=1 Tax=Acorus gramineus TaxID=55184 RepID=A0AAV9BP27_ACOGR|nr:Dolichyl-diphosphooligosaccharide--protein glycosyltransferase subunit DAD1 [Acorus gramineus]